jgi:tRNA A-37 threonylcarbamoyl transferase component Bud32
MNLENVIAERKTKTIYRDGDSVVKLFNQNYSKADILNEALNQARVEEVGLNIPKILEVTSHEGMWAIRSEFIEGQTLSHLMRDDPENKDRYLEMLVDTQMLIHSRRCPLLSRLKDKMNRKILSADLEPVTRYELLIRLEGLPTHDKLCHGDLCPSNIILTPEGELYIIDWAHATQGNASADVARTYLLFCLQGDEEGAKFCGGAPYCVYRQKDLFWHDLRFLYDCVADTSAMPMLWFNPLHDDPEGYKKHFDPDEAVLQPYYYNAFRKEHWTPVESRTEYVAYYNEDRYKDLGIKFVEQDPYLVKFREQTIPLMEEGYLYLPCASVYNRCDWNHSDLVEYFRDNAPDEQILGYMSAPWARTIWDFKERYDETFKFFKEAKEKFYK